MTDKRKPGGWRRDIPRLATANNIERFPISNAPSAASSCPAGGGHHWVIAIPNGPFADGHCKKCGKEKAFRNALELDTTFVVDGTMYGSYHGRERAS